MSANRDIPFVGLKPFETTQADFFFGREREIPLVINNLIANRLTLLYAASGAGKTSLLNAGVAHTLGQQAAREIAQSGLPERALIVFREWQTDPVQTLLHQVDRTLCDLMALPYPDPPTPPQEFVERLRQWTEAFGVQLLLILDQFEEYFLYPDAQARGPGSFFHEFVRLVNDPLLNVNVLVSMREDALSRLDRFEGHVPTLFNNLLRIEPLSREAGGQAIRGPIERYNSLLPTETAPVEIQAETIEAILTDVEEGKVAFAGQGEGLGQTRKEDGPRAIQAPYLQLVMEQLWEHEIVQARAHEIRLSTYEAMGRAQQITGEHLDRILGQLSPAQQRVAATMFKFLVTPSGSKLAQSASDLRAAVVEERGAESGTMAQGLQLRRDVKNILALLSSGSARILRVDSDARGTPRYEIFHDVLGAAILEWRREYEARAEAAAARRRIQQLSGVVLLVALALVGAIALALFALQQQRLARAAEQDAEAAAAEAVQAQATAVSAQATAVADAERARQAEQRAQAQAFAGQSLFELSQGNPERAWLSALAAVRASAEGNELINRALLESLEGTALRRTLEGDGEIFSVAWSPDGRRVLMGGQNGTARIWDATNGESLQVWTAHPGGVISVGWSPESEQVLTAGFDWTEKEVQTLALFVGEAPMSEVLDTIYTGSARIWDITSNEIKGLPNAGFSAAWSPDGARVLTGGGFGPSRIWDARSGESLRLLGGPLGLFFSVAWSPDGQQVLTANLVGPARFWDTTTGRSLRVLDGHLEGTWSVAWSPDGTRVLTGGLSDGTARIWDVASGESLHVLGGHDESLVSVAWSPDGQRVLTGGGNSMVRIWDARYGAILQTLKGAGVGTSSVAWSPDGTQVLTGGWGGARIWDAVSGASVRTLEGPEKGIMLVAWSPDGTQVLTTENDGTARIWDATSGKGLHTLKEELYTLAMGVVGYERPIWSPDGAQVLMVGSGTVRVWDVASGERAHVLGRPGGTSSATWSSDGTRVLTMNYDGIARIWDVASGARVHLLEGAMELRGATWSPDGRLVLITEYDGTAWIWDAAKGVRVHTFTGHGEGILEAVWSPDGTRVLTRGLDETVQIWDAASGARVQVLKGESAGIEGVVWSPDSSQVLVMNSDYTVQVWDIASGVSGPPLEGYEGEIISSSIAWGPDRRQVLAMTGTTPWDPWGVPWIWDVASGEGVLLRGHSSGVKSVVWSPDGKQVLTVGADRTARIWDASSGESVRVLSDVTEATWSPDGRQVLTGNNDGTVRMWIVANSLLIARTTELICANVHDDEEIRRTAIADWRGCEAELAAVAEDLAEYHRLRPEE